MSEGFSIVMPCEQNRLELLVNTLEKYKEFGIPKDTEFLLPSRTLNKDLKDIAGVAITVLPYEWQGKEFNPSKALNLGVNNAKSQYIIIASPEVKPITNVLEQLTPYKGSNIMCQVFDEGKDGKFTMSLVNKKFRGDNMGMYFLALFYKPSLERINGWDEDFMQGYAWEDTDFGNRWQRARIPFEVKEEIQAYHQYHVRGDGTSPGYIINRNLLERNDMNLVTRVKNGLVKE